MTRASVAEKLGLPMKARLVAHAAHAHEPGLFSTAPVPAIRKVLEKAGWTVEDVALFEVNEAFAVVDTVAATEIGIQDGKLKEEWRQTAVGRQRGHERGRQM